MRTFKIILFFIPLLFVAGYVQVAGKLGVEFGFENARRFIGFYQDISK